MGCRAFTSKALVLAVQSELISGSSSSFYPILSTKKVVRNFLKHKLTAYRFTDGNLHGTRVMFLTICLVVSGMICVKSLASSILLVQYRRQY